MTTTVPPLDDRLADARLKLHRLQTGSLAEEVDTGTYRTRFTRADIDKLSAYISRLEAEQRGTPTRGAIGIIF